MAEMWRIVSQRQTEELNPSGTGFEVVWIVTYQVNSGPAQGATGSVKLSALNYSADAVRELVQSEVDKITEVAAL